MVEFDPFAGIFVAQEQRPTYLQDVDFRELTSFERALLVIDGTVTRFLEAQKVEPIEIVECGRSKDTLRKDHVWLDVPKGSVVASRRVLLRGGNFVHRPPNCFFHPFRYHQGSGGAVNAATIPSS